MPPARVVANTTPVKAAAATPTKSAGKAAAATPPAKPAAAATPPAKPAASAEAWASPRLDSVVPTAATASVSPSHRPFLYLSNDLCALVISSWLVPTVKRPFKGMPTFIFAVLTQFFFLLYMGVAIRASTDASPCATPALLQLVTLATFGAGRKADGPCSTNEWPVATLQ